MDLDGLFVDMYGTLTTGDRAAVEDACRAVIADTALPLTAHELSIIWGDRFFAAMEQANNSRFKPLHRLEADTLRETLTDFGVHVAPEPYAQILIDYWRSPPLQPEAAAFLAECPVPLWIVSNADRADVESALARHGLRVAGLLTSEDACSYKPDGAIFAAALAQTRWRPERVVHVGDSLHSDVDGAQRAGLRAAWINRAHRIHDIGTAQPEYEFPDLHALLAALPKLASDSRRTTSVCR